MSLRGVLSFELSWQAAAITAACLLALAAGIRMVQRLAGRNRVVSAAGVLQELGILTVLFALWRLAGQYSVLGVSDALERGQWIWHAERLLHLPGEASVQAAFLPHPLIVEGFNLFYAALHFTALVIWLAWLFFRHRDHYRQWRTTLGLLTFGCLIVQLVPVAPPRMLATDGLVDTGLLYGQSVYGSDGGFNPDQLSAMPSVHVGWAVLIAVTVICVSRSRWRWMILAYPAATTLAVIVTANHFWLDGIAATGLLGLALLVQVAGRAALRALDAAGRIPRWAAGFAAPWTVRPVVPSAPVQPAVDGPAVDGSALDGAAVRGAAVRGAAVRGAAVRGAAVRGAAVRGAAVDGAAAAQPPVDGAAAAQSIVDGVAVNGQAGNGRRANGRPVSLPHLNGQAARSPRTNGHPASGVPAPRPAGAPAGADTKSGAAVTGQRDAGFPGEH